MNIETMVALAAMSKGMSLNENFLMNANNCKSIFMGEAESYFCCEGDESSCFNRNAVIDDLRSFFAQDNWHEEFLDLLGTIGWRTFPALADQRIYSLDSHHWKLFLDIYCDKWNKERGELALVHIPPPQ